MKVLKKESEAIQQVAQEAIALLKQAYEKLEEAYGEEGAIHVHDMKAAECFVQAGVSIEAAAAWLNLDDGNEERWCRPTPDVPMDGTCFEF